MSTLKFGEKQILRLSEKLIGNKNAFTLENRVFNSVCVISLAILCIFIPFNFWIGLPAVAGIFLVSFFICIFVYYLARYKKKYQPGTTVFAIVTLTALAINYFLNDGIEGPTLLGFFLSFLFVIAIKPARTYWLWTLVHIAVVLVLYMYEGHYPDSVEHNYSSHYLLALDMFVTYLVILVFLFFVINFIRRNYYYEKLSAERRAEAIETQHLQIAAQHLQLERLNQEKNKLFSIISHDLKSPLDSIHSYLELLSAQLIGPEERAVMEKELLLLTGNTTELLQNLLSWSKSQMEGAAIKLIKLNIYDALHGSLDVQERIAANKGIKLSYSLEDSVFITADYDMLQLVVRNLVSNAIKFTETGGEIKVKSFVKGDHCEIWINDSGKGIPKDMQANIFTLKTASTFGTMNEKGVGLGLVLCKEFTELQGGRIWFDTREGAGTTFYISLPLHTDAQLQMPF